jgi:hypothetical protein
MSKAEQNSLHIPQSSRMSLYSHSILQNSIQLCCGSSTTLAPLTQKIDTIFLHAHMSLF